VATTDDLIARVRLELGDQATQFTHTFYSDGSTKDVYVNYKPLDPYTLIVSVNGTEIAKPADYTVEANLGVIHFTTAPATDAAVVVSGQHYRYFTDDDLNTFLNTALTQHTTGRADSYGRQLNVGILAPIEEYPVILLTVVEALWALATDAAFDINIQAPDGVMIPRSQRFMQLSQIIGQRKEQYRELCALLNIGLYRIEMGTLRRTSRTTNKLVPVYMPQEVEDSRRPARVYLENNMLGYTPTPSTAQAYDIIFTQGDSWSAVFDFPFNLTGYTAKAQMRTYPNAPASYGDFTVTYTNRALGQITLSLTNTATAYLPSRMYWDLQLTADNDPTYEQTYIKGLVFVDPQVTLD
jgi:hypothetical protein